MHLLSLAHLGISIGDSPVVAADVVVVADVVSMEKVDVIIVIFTFKTHIC